MSSAAAASASVSETAASRMPQSHSEVPRKRNGFEGLSGAKSSSSGCSSGGAAGGAAAGGAAAGAAFIGDCSALADSDKPLVFKKTFLVTKEGKTLNYTAMFGRCSYYVKNHLKDLYGSKASWNLKQRHWMIWSEVSEDHRAVLLSEAVKCLPMAEAFKAKTTKLKADIKASVNAAAAEPAAAAAEPFCVKMKFKN